mgnify:FL=1
MLDITIEKSDATGLWRATSTLEGVPPLTIIRHKADKDDLEYEIRRAYSDLIEELVTKQLKEYF